MQHQRSKTVYHLVVNSSAEAASIMAIAIKHAVAVRAVNRVWVSVNIQIFLEYFDLNSEAAVSAAPSPSSRRCSCGWCAWLL